MEPKNNPIQLDDAIRAMEQTEVSAEQVKASTARIFDALKSEPASIVPDRLRSEADFASLLRPYANNELKEAQRMLVEDRLASNASYRRQLDDLRGNVRVMAPAQGKRSATRSVVPWAIAAGLLVTTGYFTMDTMDRLMAPSGARAEISSASGEIFKVSAAGLESVKPGAPLAEGEAIRTAKGSSAVVRLPDGSLIEMNERAELSISAAYSGSTIRLERGNILVQAAKQKRGTLKVATKDSTVSVKGTIFSVAAGMRGTQVAVVEGHVVVDQGGKTEDLLPGQVTGSQASLKRSNVGEQIAWSKDSARYMTMLTELSKISKQIEALPMPGLRNSSKLMGYLPADTVVYVAIPNLSGTIADATMIFEDKLKQSPVLQEWWSSKQVSEARDIAEKLRSAGSQLGDEIVIAASRNGAKGLGSPIVLAEVKGGTARKSLESQIQQMAGEMKLADHMQLSDDLLVVGENPKLAGGFVNTTLAATVKKSYDKGAGWILAVDLEQILSQSVNSNMSFTGINQVRHLMVERRDVSGKSDTRASVSFSSARSGMASWLAAPAPMPSLDYISPDATFAMSAVTKDARLVAEEFFAAMGGAAAAIGEIEKQIGVNVLEDLAGPLGGEITMAVDGALLPVPTYVFATEVYDASRLTSSLRRVVDALNKRGAPALTLTEQNVNGRVFYSVKSTAMPTELNFVYSGGYMVAAASRDTINKALQTRNTLLSLPRSQRFRELLPADASVNASAVLYVNLGTGVEGLAEMMKKDLSAVSGPVLITAYAGPDSITVASSSGFFGFGLDSLLAAGKGAPILPQLVGRAVGGTGIMNRQKVQ